MRWPFDQGTSLGTERLRNRHERRRARRLGAKTRQPSPLLFETLEQRLLLSGTPLPVGTVLSSDTAPAIVQDADGTQLNVAVTGAGHWQVVQGVDAPEVTFTATTAGSAIAMTTTGGDGRFLIGGLEVDSSAKSLTGTGIDLQGFVNIKATIGSFSIGDVAANSTASFDDSAGRFDTDRLVIGNTGSASLTVEAGGRLITEPHDGTGVAAEIAAAAGSAGSQATVKGTGSLWQIGGELVVGGGASGTLSVAAGGAVIASSLTAGEAAGGVGIISVIGAGSRLSTTGELAIGDAGSSTLTINDHGIVTAGSAVFGAQKTGSAVINLTGAGAELDVAGTLTLGGAGSATLVLGKGATLSVGALSLGKGGLLTSAGGAISGLTLGSPPALTAALANQTGAKATTDATITGTVTAPSGLATLRGGLGATAVTGYVDLTDQVAANGAFTLTPAQLAAMNGGTLPDGSYTLHLIAIGRDGQTRTVDTSFTLATAAPAISSFALANSSETGAPGSNTSAYARVALTGVADPGATLTLNGTSVVAGAGGVFQIPDVDLVAGANNFTLTATNAAGLQTSANLTVTRQGVTGTDVSLTWNEVALDICKAYNLYPEDVTRVLAMVGLAQYDTLAAIEGTASFLVQRTASGPTDTSLALAQAAYTILVTLFPAQKQVADDALAPTLAAVSDATTRANSIALGQDIGQTTVAIRATDGADAFVSYAGGTDLGEWSPTAPTFQVAEDPQWGSVTPFAIGSAADYMAPPPPDITSADWAAAYNLTITLGSATSTARTADQTQQALFWADGGGSSKPPGHWNKIAQAVAAAQGNSLSANVRLFAQLNTAMADAAIATWLTKYTYGTWRPIQAAADASLIGNPLASSVDGWTPFLVTPSHPEYVSGHSTFSAAAAEVLIATFGDNVSFSATSETLPGVTRNFTSFSQAVDEAGMSRIYGGIHFSFSNDQGQIVGQKVGAAVLARFALTEDTQGPSVLAAASPSVSKTNVTLAGQVIDNLSGVAGATYRIDSGAAAALVLDADGRFSISTVLAVDGTADGAHVITISATDVAGNASAVFTRSFTLDTKAPTITMPSLADGAVLDTKSRVTGTADPTGSTLVALSYKIDGGITHPVAFDLTTGTFDDPLPVRDLGIGSHTLVLTAQDAAGNITTLTRNVTVAELAPFAITGFTPDAGSLDVGVTQRPRIEFSRAINISTLTAANFYATRPDGSVLATTIVPAADGSYAWLFFNDPMPGGSVITVHVIGSGIRAAADGTFLDATNTGNGASTLTFSFTTVSTAGVANTKLVGRVVDPGDDAQPMTYDDTRRGPDGIPHTADDVYLHPIVGARVSIIGQSTVVFTDANGYFELDDIPAGDVKLVIDGRTATNAPATYFWPEMVMDLTIKPGITNTPMSSMGSAEEQAANIGIQATFLPRVDSSALQTVNTTGTTTVTATLNAAPTLTDEERSNLSLTVQAGTALGADGKPLDNVQIGVATVDPLLVRDMLPAGVLEHTFDITIQAPGVSTFSAPVEIKFPNVFNAAPGTKLNVLSFDHTTGRLVINGTATVSADGKYAISDPGQGVIAPGWHGLTPPGDCGGSGGPPAPPPPPTPNDTTHENDPESLPLILDESGSFSRSWTAPAPLPGTVPGPPPSPGDCPTPPADPPGQKQPFETVTIEITGPLAEYMKATGNLPLTTQSFTLTAGAGNTKTFSMSAKTFAELLPGGFKSIETNILYGSKIRITDVTGASDGSTHTEISTYFLYRFLDTTDDQHSDGTMSFAQTINDGPVKTYRANPLTLKVGGGDPTLELDNKTNFYSANLLGEVWFDPTQVGDNLTAGIDIKNPLNGKSAGQIKVAGKGVQEQGYFIDQTSFDTLLADMAADTKAVKYPSLTASDRALIDTKAERDTIFGLIQAQTTAIFTDGQLQSGIYESSTQAGNVLNIAFVQGANPSPGNGWPLGGAVGALTSADVDLAALVDLNKNAGDYSQHQRAFLTSKYVNNQLGGNINFYLDNFFEGQFGMDTNAKIKYAMGMNDAHEIGHHLGLFHTGTSSTVYVYKGSGGETDIMRQGLYLADTQKFGKTDAAAKIGLHMNYSLAEVDTALAYYAAYQAARTANPGWYGNTAGADSSDSGPAVTPEVTPFLSVLNQDLGVIGSTFDMGTVVADGAGGATFSTTWQIANLGVGSLKLTGIKGADTLAGISYTTDLINTGIDGGTSKGLTLTFDPSHAGNFSNVLEFTTEHGQVVDITLTGTAITAGPSLKFDIINNNLGGAKVDSGAVTSSSVGRITNVGAQDLVISDISMISGASDFSLSGWSGKSVTLKTNESLVIGGAFDPSDAGLRLGQFSIKSNDSATPNFVGSMVGTGYTSILYPEWGKDYVSVDYPDTPTTPALRTVSDTKGNFSFFLPSLTDYHVSVFDPTTGLIAADYGTTPASGTGTNLSSGLVFRASTAQDSDFDGLPDDIEATVGTNRARKDTDGDGLTDFAEIKQGLDPLGGLGIPVGVASTVSLTGTAEAVSVLGSSSDPLSLTAVVATGTGGLSVVGVTKSINMSVLAELDLTGTNVGLAVDAARNLVAVAGSEAGLHIVDISDTSAPTLLGTVEFANPVVAVAVNDAIAYVASGTSITTVDMITREVRSTLDLGSLGGTTLTGLVLQNGTLFTIDATNKVRAISIDGDALTARGSLTVAAGNGHLAVGGSVLYVQAGNGGTGGFLTVDITNLDALTLLSGVDLNGAGGTSMALTGSGLGVAVGSSSFVFGSFKSVDLFDLSDPTNTGKFLTRINLPEIPRDIALANGFAFVADGAGGLKLVNYLGLDSAGIPPAISIDVNSVDVDPATPGVQVIEGSTVQITPTVSDDVQIRNVELLVNGKVVQNDVAYPFQMTTQVPSIASGGTTLTLIARAIDTGGNETESAPVVLQVVKDTFPPVLKRASIDDGASKFFVKSFDFTFSKPLDITKLNVSGMTLTGAGTDSKLGTADDVAVPLTFTTRSFGQVLTILTGSALGAGSYRLTIDPSILSDVSGNQYVGSIVRNFTVRPASDIQAASGVPAITQEPSANPGQQIGIAVPFDPSTAHMSISRIDSSGTKTVADLVPVRVDTFNGKAIFQVPFDAVTDDVTVYSKVGAVRTDFADGTFPLEIVPIVSGITVNSVAFDGSSVSITLNGLGFIEGNGTEYKFGSTSVVDSSVGAGPDVYDRYNGAPTFDYTSNGSVNITVPLTDAAYGPITVKTVGGTSTPFAVNLTSVTATALSGTPADASIASANPGQAVTLNGSGLSTNTGVVLRWRDSGGANRAVLLRPTTAAADGSQATLVLPNYVNGITTLDVLGSSVRPTVQIVPTLVSYSRSGGTLQLSGTGLAEGASTFSIAGVTVDDTSASTGPDVYGRSDIYNAFFENGRVDLAEPVHGFGDVTVQTAGGTSAPLALNVANPGTGAPGDIAVDATGKIWISDQANPGHLLQIDPATGQTLNTITMTNAFGTPYAFNYAGLQVLGSAMTLNGTSVPAGSLLLFNGYPNPDQITAINPATGVVVASLTLGANYDLKAGVYDTTTGHLFITDSRSNPARIVEIDPATGAVVPSTGFAIPSGNPGWIGMAIDPTSHNIWFGSTDSTEIIEFTRTGTEVRRFNVGFQGADEGEITGLAFDSAGRLLVSSTSGVIYRIDLGAQQTTTKPTLTSIISVATGGTPADAAVASANAGQVIELHGTNFGTNTQVVFKTRDSSGNTSEVSVAPLVVNAPSGGTVLQVAVPTQAMTDDVRVVNVGAQNLGFGSWPDAVYRNVSVSFTATGPTTTVNFTDGGLEGIGNESWGLDNVVVSKNGTALFTDNFENGAKPSWSVSTVDTSSRGVFSAFSGRFSNGSQTLSLGGLTTGQVYTVTFDLYILDSWDGTNTSGGPDYFQVSAGTTTLMREAFGNFPTTPQTYNSSASLRLQVVPTLTGISNGRPGLDNTYDLTGSGFMEGASTVTVGGVVFQTPQSNESSFDVTGSDNNDFRVTTPLVLDGPIIVTTEGGSAQLPAPSFGPQPAVQFDGIQASAASGIAADSAKPSANAGQAITLIGQGFKSSTLVQFQGVDDAGVVGTVTRTGTVNGTGTQLTIYVPQLARTGVVRVLGSNAAYVLQVVPTLRAIGGTVASGNTIIVEGTGLVSAELQAQIDGRGVGDFAVRTIADNNPNTFVSSPVNGQQLLTLKVPAGVGAGVVTVSTAGGSITINTGTVAVQSSQTPAADVGDTLATAQVVTVARGNQVTFSASVGDNATLASKAQDIDLYQVTIAAGDKLTVGVLPTNYGHLRVFDSKGVELSSLYLTANSLATVPLDAMAAGTYYVGVSAYDNLSYDPATGVSTVGSYSGSYQVSFRVQGSADTRLTSISSVAGSGTPAQTGVASANIGQTITLLGNGLAADQKVLFETIDVSGNRATTQITPVSIAADGKSLTVVVPNEATTGAVRLVNDTAGILLQVVPILSTLTIPTGYPNGYPFGSNSYTLTATGSGFAEGAVSLNFGASKLVDPSRSAGMDVYYGTVINGSVSFVPTTAVPSGPFSISTAGGTSAALDVAFTGLVSTAGSGTPTDATKASANPGQAITLSGSGFTTTTVVIFELIDSAGNRSQAAFLPNVVNAAGTTLTVTVPKNAVTGKVRVLGDKNGTEVFLQIVPVVTGLSVSSVSSDGTAASVTVSGLGMIEANNTEYRFGTTVVLDEGANTGPDAVDRYNGAPTYDYTLNGASNLSVPLNSGSFGPIRVKTAGGISAPYSLALTSITATALSGTPADAAKASANPGQAVQLNGTGLTTSTGIFMRSVDTNGNSRTVLLTPTTASSDGTHATLVLPTYANGVVTLDVLGSSTRPTIQIVPTIIGYSRSGGTLTLTGRGFQENGTTYAIAGVSVVDSTASDSADVYGYSDQTIQQSIDSGAVNINEPVHGLGNITVQTAGGTSAAFALNEFNPGAGAPGDLAVDAAGMVWISDQSNPGHLVRIDPSTGATLQTITMTNGFGTPYAFNYAGLQSLPNTISLGGTSVPSGSLLLFNGYPNPDQVIAINPTSGAIVATLALSQNYDLKAGLYDPTSGHLFITSSQTSPAHMVEIDPATGVELSNVVLPFANPGWSGLAIDPTTHNFWYGSTDSTEIVLLTRAGTEVRRFNLAPYGADEGEISGLAFDAAGKLLVSSTSGVIYRIDLNADQAITKPALTSIVATAQNGTPANAAVASSNVGDVIELHGTNFGWNTQVVFQLRDNAGNLSEQSVVPLAINAAGTVLQVQVPDAATTGNLRVVNIARRDLGYSSYPDAIYRAVTLNFTAGSSTAQLNFGDGGIEGVSNESWGIDNVKVSRGATTVFADNFEGAANAAWTSPSVDAASIGLFTRFSGRFSNASQTLNLSGLTAGQTYTLTFDLYVLDSWDGSSTNGGPDYFRVKADNTVLMQDTFANFATSAQSFNSSAPVRLQIVPTLTSTSNGQPGTDRSFNLQGSGFMEGASTLTVGGVSMPISFTNQFEFNVTGARNSDYQVILPQALDGPITITTEGGSAQLATASFANQPVSSFTGIKAAAQSGAAADGTKASANVGQAITLTGQGFTSSTLVRFQATDATGVSGTVTRTGSVNASGTQLTIVVPELAKTGQVQVLGSGASFLLQVVPVIRAVGGTVAAGNTIEIDGTGFVSGAVTAKIDGIDATVTSIRAIADSNPSSFAANAMGSQQLMTILVPNGVTAGVITLTTPGGSVTFKRGITIAQQTLTPASEVGDTLATALATTLQTDTNLVESASLGDNAAVVPAGLDVDLYKVSLTGGDQLSLNVDGSPYTLVRVFDAAGNELAKQNFTPFADTPLVVGATGSGTYYVGVSSYYNNNYDVTKAGSGTDSNAALYTGSYQLTMTRLGSADTRLTGITTTADKGTAAQAGVASANAGQTITLTGSGLTSADRVVFAQIDSNGYMSASSPIVPASVASDGSSLTIVVPASATTGMVRLVGDTAGILLQIVPTLTDVQGTKNTTLTGSSVSLLGSGFAEGATTVNFGATKLVDTSRSSGLDVTTNTDANQRIFLSMPNGVPTGPISVTTAGGTSAAFGLTFTGVTAAATSGTPTDGTKASANPGQTITLTGTGFDTGTDIVFEIVDSNGTKNQVVVAPATVNGAGTSLTVVVPLNAVTGVIRIVGDQNAAALALQIVPVINALTVNSVASDGSSVNIMLTGLGLVEANASEYRFGSTLIFDNSPAAGPDVQDRYNGAPTFDYTLNGQTSMTVPLYNGTFGSIVVKTAGGTSAAYTASLTSITATALSGTPADASKASANPGQAVTLNGANLSTKTGVMLTYRESGSGTRQTILLNPVATAADGTSATLELPNYVNGIVSIDILGSTGRQTLQIVPTITGYSRSGGTISLYGRGFVEGASSYSIAGSVVTDTLANSGPNVYGVFNSAFQQSIENSAVDIAEPVHGLGNVTVQTDGGTSAPYALNVINPGTGAPGDIAVDAAGKIWVSDQSNPGHLLKIDPATGATLTSITLTNAFGTPYAFNYAGLQVLGTGISLASTAVPAGSLLVFNGYPNPDRILAVNPTTGAVIASLSTVQNYDLKAGLYDPTSGHLFVTSSLTNPARVYEINPDTGAEISNFALPAGNPGWVGLAIDPATNNIWFGSTDSTEIVLLTRTGTEVRRFNVALQGADEGEISGLAFDSAGKLLVASTSGVIFRIDLGADTAAIRTATLTSIVATATNGSASNPALPSANVHQVIELHGTNFGDNTQVVFVIDTNGTKSDLLVAPLVVSLDGTTLQVEVPANATADGVRVVNTGYRDLGYSSYNDAIYRNVTLSFTADAAAMAVTFQDEGLEGIGNESWGLDNVSVTQGATTLFSDNFENGANAAWSVGTLDTASRGLFTSYLGRFSNGSTTLNLSGLTAGQTYSLKFDLYILDSWDGTNTSAGPDTIKVTAGTTTILRTQFTNYPRSSLQTYGRSAPISLQIV